MVNANFLRFDLLVLVLSTVIGTVTCTHIVKRTQRVLTFRFLLVANTVLIGPVSGIIHLSRFDGASRGYYDVTVSPGAGVATIGTALATLTVCAVTARIPPGVGRLHYALPTIARKQRLLLLSASAILLPVSVYAILKVQRFASDSGLVRLISVDQGFARYSFISNWFVWAVSFTALLAVASTRIKAPLIAALIVLAAVLAVAASLSWTGGRSIILVMTLPLLMVTVPQLGKSKAIVGFGVSAIVLYVVITVSGVRSQTSTAAAYLGVPTWFDWQWGRYSLLGFASNYSTHTGLLWGQTFVASISHFLEGSARLLSLRLGGDGLHEVTEITGAQLVGDSKAIYIVPGLTAELYLNFGLVGIVLGIAVLGKLVTWCDRRLDGSSTPISKLGWAYVGTLLVFRCLTSSSGAILSYLFYIGFPLLAVCLIANFPHRPSRHREGGDSNSTNFVPTHSGRAAVNNRNDGIDESHVGVQQKLDRVTEWKVKRG